jgi:tetratricopeptide (TPR) repeat protein
MSLKSRVLHLGLPVPCFVVAASILWSAPFLQAAGPQSRPSPGAISSMSETPQPPDSPPEQVSQSRIVRRRNRAPISTNEYDCFLPPLNSVSRATISVVDLKVPGKPHSEFESGCDALHKNKMADAEKHLRKAVQQYENYAAAWVLLGQLLETQQKPEEARAACSKSLNASLTYVPAYLCLTDISARQKNWDDVLKFSARVLELEPTSNALAYAYHATADLKLHHLLEAEKSALRALELDVRNSEPRIHFLLAQIYAAKGDRSNTAAQLREYLKFAKDPDDVALVKSNLAKLESGAAR